MNLTPTINTMYKPFQLAGSQSEAEKQAAAYIEKHDEVSLKEASEAAGRKYNMSAHSAKIAWKSLY